MDDTTRSHLEADLRERLTRLEAEVHELDSGERELLSEASGENAYRDHMADQGSATFERELDLTLEENLRDQLVAVRNAVNRIDADTYGVCERCGVDIPEERLEAVPTASLCVKCKEAEESR
ncbi:MAG: TraR/DksA C4-type zinc finger protein [Coriobacteriia bacterium]|nr:TraR/DksA C4-type zinc finger protein [Coriobacteriia bacterium]